MSENNVNSTEEIVLSVEMGDAVSAQTAEAYAVGKRGGVDVAETDPTWHNNAKYYAEQAEEAAGEAQGAEEAAQRAEAAQAAAEAARDRAEAIGAGAVQSAAAAAESAQAAATAKTGAETAQSAAAGSATAAEGSAGRASQSATAAAGSATAAGTAKTAAEAARDAAAGSATAAAGSASAADQSAQAAAASAQAAEDVAESIPADYSQLSADVTGLKSALKNISPLQTIMTPYLYKKDSYIDNTIHDVVDASGFDTYQIPLEGGNVYLLTWDADTPPFRSSLERNRAVKIYYSDGTWKNFTANAGDAEHYFFTSGQAIVVLASSNMQYLYVTCVAGTESGVNIYRNEKFPVINQMGDHRVIDVVKDYSNYISTRIFMNARGTLALVADPHLCLIVPVVSGDVIDAVKPADALSYYCSLVDSSGTVTTYNVPQVITVNDIGFAFILFTPDSAEDMHYCPKECLETYGTHYIGLQGVAFGASLTYRAQTTGGYLQYLPGLAKMTVENQGIGGAQIVGRPSQGTRGAMMTALMDYTQYAEKDLCIVEGFVNDWYNNKPLGTFTDSEENTVCGCLSVAINNMRTINPDITVIVILDPCGRNDGTADFTRATTNQNGLTQYAYYDEVEKCCAYNGVKCINLLKTSEIGENTPQYYIDYIHPNDLGARQTALTIWGEMQRWYPNVTN